MEKRRKEMDYNSKFWNKLTFWNGRENKIYPEVSSHQCKKWYLLESLQLITWDNKMLSKCQENTGELLGNYKEEIFFLFIEYYWYRRACSEVACLKPAIAGTFP